MPLSLIFQQDQSPLEPGAKTTTDNVELSSLPRIFLYHFTHRTTNSPWPTWSGVMHGDEIAYVFGDPLRLHPSVIYTEQERALSRDMMTYWANFAKSG